MPSARSVGATYVECRVIFVWMHLRESELNNKFECKNHVYTQKLQIMGLIIISVNMLVCVSVSEFHSFLIMVCIEGLSSQ